jgi:hypothetical protein
MWRRFTNPDVLVYLNVSREVAQCRQARELPLGWWTETQERLAHARSHADVLVEADLLAPEAVLREVLNLLGNALALEPPS